MSVIMNTSVFPTDVIRYIGGFLEGADLFNFAHICKAAKKAFETLVSYKIASFTQVHAEYFQNVHNFFDPNYPYYELLLDMPRDNEGFLPDFASKPEDRRILIGKNSVKFFLKEAGELHEEKPEFLYKMYQLAHEKIKLLKTPLSMAKTFEIICFKIELQVDKTKQRMNNLVRESFKQILVTADRTNIFVRENYHQIAVVAGITAIVGQVLYQSIG